MHTQTFAGLPAQSVIFLRDLALNNTRDWFDANRADYEELVRDPLRGLRAALLPGMLAVDPAFERGPGAGLSRIRRDTRFSRDKSPFRPRQWISFKRPGAEWTGRPGFFLEISPEACRHGMGFYCAGTRVMAELRALAGERPAEYAAAMTGAEGAGYDLVGEVYKRPRQPQGGDALPECVRELHRRRNVALVQEIPLEKALGNPGLAGILTAAYSAAAPLYRLWIEALERAARPAAPAEDDWG